MKNQLTPELLADLATRYIDYRDAEIRDTAAVPEATRGNRWEERECAIRASSSLAAMQTYWRTLEVFLSPGDLVLLAKEIQRRDRERNRVLTEEVLA